MTSALDLTITLPPAKAVKAGVYLQQRHLGPLGRLAVMMLAPLAGGALFAFGFAWLIGESWLTAGIIGLYTYFGITIGFVVAQNIWFRRQRHLLTRSQMRNLPSPITMDDSGITFHPRHLPWDAVSTTARWKDCTLVHFTAIDALAIPDTDLPPGETPETFAARIAQWKAQ